MIDYKYADLYYEDSINKQLKIEAEDGSVITNEDIFSEAMTLDESLCSDSSLNFGCCEASKFYIKIANRFTQMYGQWLTVTETIDGNEDDPFLFGHYKVHSDNPTADRTYREITAYDAMYDIINADGVDVADWYNEILPDYDSTVTLKKFRQSFLEHLGIEEIDANLINDDMIVEKTIETSSLSGQRVITAICEINGVFAHITRDGKLEYIQLEPIEEDKAFDIPINMYSDYEDFETQTINCLQIREDDTDPGVVYGSGANRYIISGNFLLYGKTTEDLITITANLYPVINNISYRPATITAPGNPCIEVGDVIHLSTAYQEIYTYVLKRNFSGIQALTDTYTSDGTETYVDDGGSLQEKIEQIKSRTSELASEVKENTESINIAIERIDADYANILVLEAEIANIQTLFAEYATIEELYAAFAEIDELYVDYEEVNTLVAQNLEAVYADIGSLTADLAEIQALFADYATIDSLTALIAYINTEYVSNSTIEKLLAGYAQISDLEAVYADIGTLISDMAEIEALFANYATVENLTALQAYIEDEFVNNSTINQLLAGYATIIDLEAVSANIGTLTADIADIVALLAGEAGVGILDAIHLTTENAVIDEAVIVEALVGTVIADIIQSNVIYTDYITIMSLDGSYINTGSMEQFSDADGTVRIQIGLDASGTYNFYIADEDGNLLWDALGLTEAGLTANGAIIKDAAIADDANIAASKLDIEDLTRTLNANGDLVLSAEQITIGGGTLDYALTEITQQIEDLESMGIQYVENWYAYGTETTYPPFEWEDDDSAVLGEGVLGLMVLGVNGDSNWSTTQPSYEEGQYIWWCQEYIYFDGSIAWSTPALWTDNYLLNRITITQTELEVVQGQIEAKIWMTDITTATDAIQGEITTISEQYGVLTVLIDAIDQRVGVMETEFGDEYSELYSLVTSLTLSLDGITGRVSEVEEKTSNAITEGVPYYAYSYSPDYYPPFEWEDDDSAILGEGILGLMVLGVNGDSNWTTEQPEYQEGQYIWIAYFRTRVDGSTYWTTPTLLTDEWARQNVSEMSERYSQLVLTLDSALLEVANIRSTLTSDYSTTEETRAAIEMAVEDSEASILIIVSDLESTVTDEFVEMSDRMAEISTDLNGITARVQDVEAVTANALVEGVPYYAISYSPDYYPPFEDSVWTTDQPDFQEGQYIWISYYRTRVDGSTYWTEPTLLTDEWARQNFSYMSEQYAQIVMQVDSIIAEVVNVQSLLTSDYSTTSEVRAAIEMAVEDSEASILMVVSNFETEVTSEFTTVSERFATIETNLDGISLHVEDVESKTANALTEGIPYYAVSYGPDYYPPFDWEDDDNAILGEGILGLMVLGANGDSVWTTEQPDYQDGQYIWIAYLRTRVDGSTYWTEPTLLTDDWLRKNAAETSERYSQLVLTLDSALLEVYSSIATVEGNITTLDASIREYVDETSADILSKVAGLYVTDDEFTSVTASIEQYVDSQTASIRSDLEKNYVTNGTLETAVNTIDQNISDTENSILIKVSDTYVNFDELGDTLYDYSKIDETVAKVETYYAVSDNPDSPYTTGDTEEIFNDVFTSRLWVTSHRSPSSVTWGDSDTLGSCYRIVRSTSSKPCIRKESLDYEGNSEYRFEIEVATEEGYENDVEIQVGVSETSEVSEENLVDVSEPLKSDEWTTVSGTFTLSSDMLSSYFYIYNSSDYSLSVPLLVRSAKVSRLSQPPQVEWSPDYPSISAGQYLWVRNLITYVDGTQEWGEPYCISSDVDLSDYPTMSIMNATIEAYIGDSESYILSQVEGTYVTNGEFTESISSIEQYVSESLSSISLTVSGGLGGTASIVMTAGDTSTSASLDLSNVREAFRDETSSSITITGGTITFNSGTIVINSSNFSVTSSGVITASSGTIGGWYITSTRIRSSSDVSIGGSVAGLLLINESDKPYLNAQDGNGNTTFQIARDGSATFAGSLNAATGSFSGTVTATTLTATSSGRIANWYISSSAIASTSGGGFNSSGVMYFGSSGLSLSSSFRVTSGGVLYATSGNFSGAITSSTISGTTINGGTIYGTNYYTTTGNDSSIFTDGFRIYETSITSYGTSVIRFRSNSDSSSNLMRIRAMTESSGVAISQQSIATEVYLIVDNLSVTGSKSRLVETNDYGQKLTQAYETATPYFGDIGSGETDENGLCYISIDDVFAETVNTTEYVVFLQKEGQGDLWIKEKESDYFVIEGTPNLLFAWELKAVQRDYETVYMNDGGIFITGLPDGELEEDFDEELEEIDKELEDLLAV